jgi:Flp pilus assembly protein TadD
LYVYHEITPPQQRFYYSAPAPKIATPAPAASPQPIVAAAPPAPALVPLAPEPEITTTPESPTVAEEVTPEVITPKNKKTVTKKTAPRSARAANSKTLEIQRKQEPDSIDPILTSAYQAYQNGDHATAWQRYREALSKEPKNRDALLGLAVIAQQQGQDDTALHYYRQVLQLDPRDPVANAGLSAFGTADPASKESRLKQLIAQQPDSAALHFALGNQYAEQSRWSDAQQSYFSALAMEPTNALFAFNMAISLDHLGQRKAAAKYYQQALQFDTSGNSGFSRTQAQQRLNELTPSSH